MKIDRDIVAAGGAPIDYAMLKAALIAAQAATPTARACREPVEPAPAGLLEQMFAGSLPFAGADALGNRFSSTPSPEVDGA